MSLSRLARCLVVMLVALAAAQPALAQSATGIGDDLVAEIAGYTLVEGTPPMGSGPLSMADLAEVGGVDPDELPSMDGISGYMRLFTDGAGGAVVIIGMRGPGMVDQSFRLGFEAEGGDGLDDRRPLFPGEPEPLGDVEHYPGGTAIEGQKVALLASGDLAMVVFAGETELLRDVVRAQHALTPLDDGLNARPAGSEDDGAAYQAGRLFGMLLVLAVPALIIVYLVRRSNRRLASSEPTTTAMGSPPPPTSWSAPPPPPTSWSASPPSPPPPSPSDRDPELPPPPP